MDNIIGQHDLLLQSSNRQTAEQDVRSFFTHNELVRYDSLLIDSSTIINGTNQQFFKKMEDGLNGNKQVLEGLLRELQAEGVVNLQAWTFLQQGYATKLLHTAVHLLDGFFGVDSVLYSLIDDSHQVTGTLRNKIKENPEKYWLVHVSGASADGNADRVQMLRPFGREKRND